MSYSNSSIRSYSFCDFFKNGGSLFRVFTRISGTNQENHQDLMSIPKYLNEHFFKEALENGFRELQIEIIKIQIENITISGQNYLSDIYRASVSFVRKNKIEEEKISLIIKRMSAKTPQVFEDFQIYEKECIIYMDVKPQIDILMWKTPAWQFGAKHFYSTPKPDKTIVLEDLTEKGYYLVDRESGLDEAHCQLVIRKLGQYHAASMVLAEKHPRIIMERFPYGIVHRKRIESPGFKSFFGAQLLKLIDIVSKWKEFETITEKLKRYYEHFVDEVIAAVEPLKGKINVLNHGDLWVTNFLFKSNCDGIPEDVRLIDFHLGYYGSLGYDFNYLMYTSVQLDVMRTKRDSLIETYYEALSSTLKELKFESIQPTLEDIQSEIHSKEPYGFFVAYAFFPMMTMDKEDCQDNSLENFTNVELAKKKIDLMFKPRRTLDKFEFILKRFEELNVLK